MINLFGEEYEYPRKKQKKRDKKLEAWNRKFQKWSDEMALDPCTPDGKCGYGYICDWCTNNDHGNPCVRALSRMLREKNKSLNYENADYQAVFMTGESK